MSDGRMARTTISIEREIFALAKTRMRRLRIRSFSHYVELLLDKDIRQGGSLTVVKEEAPKYTSSTRTLRVRREHLTERPIPPADPPAQPRKSRSPEVKPDIPA